MTEIRSNLDRNGIANDVFGDLQPDPTDENVRAGANRFREVGADSILAIGGGSALDVAKMIGVASTNAEPLSRFQGYVGLTNFMGARFLANEASMQPLIREAAKRGLAYFDDGTSTRSIAAQLSK